jgi:hypothetical protein
MKPDPAPRWFWLLPLLAMAAWWPIGPAWQSDDYFALHYVQDGTNVLRDFVGPQYGAVEFWAFHRPLITASFWLEYQLGGNDPFLSHLGNVLAHALSTWLVARLWWHFVPAQAAFAAGLAWAFLPSHVGAIAWTVGRVDSYSTPWILLCLVLVLRARAARARSIRASSWPALGAMVVALLCKENAFVLPPLATLLAACASPGTWPARVRAAMRTTAPLWLLLLAWLPLRLVLLGKFGGYSAAALAPLAMLDGLGSTLGFLAAPWQWVGIATGTPSWLLAASGFVPTAAALILAIRGNWRIVLGGAGAAAVALLPTATMLTAAHNPQVLRYCYLPLVGLCGIAAAGGRFALLALLLAAVPPFVAMRFVQHAADRESRTCHTAVLEVAQRDPPMPLVVAGLPPANRGGSAIQLYFAVDRLTAPPFAEPTRPLFACRPLADTVGVFRLAPPGQATALPFGSTWIMQGTAAIPAPAAAPLPELVLVGEPLRDGVVDLTTPVLDRLLRADAPHPILRTPDVQPMAYRLTLFTAGGYLATQFLDHGGGSIDLLRWFRYDEDNRYFVGRTGIDTLMIGDALRLPAAVDLSLDFPALLEAGTVDLATYSFTPTHRCTQRLVFRFDRDYNAWANRAQGR